MNAELFVHGPRHAFYGKQDEASYSTLFDDSSVKDDIRFIVELRKGVDNKWYTYYNYCRYSNVTDIDGRSGAYLGITLRLDAYYANLRAVYTILDAVFNKGAVGLLVKKVPTGFQYLVNNFESSKSSILDKIEKPLGALLSNIMSMSEVLPIDGTFKPGGKAYLRGIDDTQAIERRLAEMRASGKIVFASSAPIEQHQVVIDQCNRDKQAFAESKQQEISKLESNLSIATKEAAAVSAKLSASELEAKRLSAEVETLKKEIASFEGERREINSLKEDKKFLSSQLRSTESKVSELQRKADKLSDELRKSDGLRDQIDGRKSDKRSLEAEIASQKKEISDLKNKQKKAEIKDDVKGEVKDLKQSLTGNAVQEEEHEEGIAFRLKRYLLPIATFLAGSIIFGVIFYFVGAGWPKLGNKNSKEPVEETVASELTDSLVLSVDTNLFPDSSKVNDYIIMSQPSFKVNEPVSALMANDKVISNGRWLVSNTEPADFDNISNRDFKFIPKVAGEYTISYIRNDTIVIQRIINVEE